MTLTLIGFVKGLGVVILFSILGYIENRANLDGVVGPTVAAVITALASSFESYLKERSGNTTALFGSVNVKG